MNNILENFGFYSFLVMFAGLFAVLFGLIFGGDYLAGMAGGSESNSFFVGVLLYVGPFVAFIGLILLIISIPLKKFIKR